MHKQGIDKRWSRSFIGGSVLKARTGHAEDEDLGDGHEARSRRLLKGLNYLRGRFGHAKSPTNIPNTSALGTPTMARQNRKHARPAETKRNRESNSCVTPPPFALLQDNGRDFLIARKNPIASSTGSLGARCIRKRRLRHRRRTHTSYVPDDWNCCGPFSNRGSKHWGGAVSDCAPRQRIERALKTEGLYARAIVSQCFVTVLFGRRLYLKIGTVHTWVTSLRRCFGLPSFGLTFWFFFSRGWIVTPFSYTGPFWMLR